MDKKIVDLYFNADIKDLLVDFLLENEISDFYYFDCKRYSMASLRRSDKEKVNGRVDFGMFRIFVDFAVFDGFFETIKGKFTKEDVRMFVYDAQRLF